MIKSTVKFIIGMLLLGTVLFGGFMLYTSVTHTPYVKPACDIMHVKFGDVVLKLDRTNLKTILPQLKSGKNAKFSCITDPNNALIIDKLSLVTKKSINHNGQLTVEISKSAGSGYLTRPYLEKKLVEDKIDVKKLIKINDMYQYKSYLFSEDKELIMDCDTYWCASQTMWKGLRVSLRFMELAKRNKDEATRYMNTAENYLNSLIVTGDTK